MRRRSFEGDLSRPQGFFAEFDELSHNRPENRLLHAALRRALSWTAAQAHQQLARELWLVFAAVPQRAPSLLFPMEAVFEAYVAKHLARQLAYPVTLRTQARSFSLVRHLEQAWFGLKPDLLVQESGANRLVLDQTWKLIDDRKATAADKYELDQGDFNCTPKVRATSMVRARWC